MKTLQVVGYTVGLTLIADIIAYGSEDGYKVGLAIMFSATALFTGALAHLANKHNEL